jgi:hypothetical protein
LEPSRIGEPFDRMNQPQSVLFQFEGMGLQMGLLKAQVLQPEIQPNSSCTGGHD